jgi:hypothetical protein
MSFEEEPIPPPESLALYDADNLVHLLQRNGIDLSVWGRAGAKTVEHLAAELSGGECLLHTGETDLVKVIKVSAVHVFFQSDDGTLLELVEDHQEFHEPGVPPRQRIRDFQQAVSEKSQLLGAEGNVWEDDHNTAIRGVDEELGITLGIEQLEVLRIEHKFEPSASYPGLVSRKAVTVFAARLTADQYKPDGYIERQPDKTTVFKWKPVSQSNG